MSAPIPFISHRQLAELIFSAEVEDLVARDIRKNLERFRLLVVQPLRRGVDPRSLLTTHARINIELAPTLARLLRQPAVVEHLHQRLEQADWLHRHLESRFDNVDSFASDLLREAHAIFVGIMRSVLASVDFSSSVDALSTVEPDTFAQDAVVEGGAFALTAMLVPACEELLSSDEPLPENFASLCELASSSARTGLEQVRQHMPVSMLPAASVVPVGFTREQWRERWRARITEDQAT